MVMIYSVYVTILNTTQILQIINQEVFVVIYYILIDKRLKSFFILPDLNNVCSGVKDPLQMISPVLYILIIMYYLGDFPILHFFRCLILFLTKHLIVLFTFHRAFSGNLFSIAKVNILSFIYSRHI
jgi:hypothetical protein